MLVGREAQVNGCAGEGAKCWGASKQKERVSPGK